MISQTSSFTLSTAKSSTRFDTAQAIQINPVTLKDPSVLDHPTRYATAAADDEVQEEEDGEIIGWHNRVDGRKKAVDDADSLEKGGEAHAERFWASKKRRAFIQFGTCGDNVRVQFYRHEGSVRAGRKINPGFLITLEGCAKSFSWSVDDSETTQTGSEIRFPNPFYAPHMSWYLQVYLVPRLVIFGEHYVPDRPQRIGVAAQEGGFHSRKCHMQVNRCTAGKYVLRVAGNMRAEPQEERLGLHKIMLRGIKLALLRRKNGGNQISDEECEVYAKAVPLLGSATDLRNIDTAQATARAIRLVQFGHFDSVGSDAFADPASSDGDEQDTVEWDRSKIGRVREERQFAEAVVRARDEGPPKTLIAFPLIRNAPAAAAWKRTNAAHLISIGEIYAHLARESSAGLVSEGDGEIVSDEVMTADTPGWDELRIPTKVFNHLKQGKAYFDRGIHESQEQWTATTVRLVIDAFAVWVRLRTGATVEGIPFAFNEKGNLVAWPGE